MLNTVRQYVPKNWDNITNQSDVNSYEEEYREISNIIDNAVHYNKASIARMIRVQDLHSYGQFLIREQLLIHSNVDQLYRVRRFIQVDRLYLNQILKYNLDPRRCGMGQTLTLKKNIDYLDTRQLIVIVKVLTTQPNTSTITPNTSSDYYVEYVIVQN